MLNIHAMPGGFLMTLLSMLQGNESNLCADRTMDVLGEDRLNEDNRNQTSLFVDRRGTLSKVFAESCKWIGLLNDAVWFPWRQKAVGTYVGVCTTDAHRPYCSNVTVSY